jgi:hypothetical protein
LTPEFIDRCVAAAADLALFFVGVSENDMLLELYQVRSNLEAQLSETWGRLGRRHPVCRGVRHRCRRAFEMT